MVGIVKSADLEDEENDFDDDADGHPVLHVEVEQPVHLAGRV